MTTIESLRKSGMKVRVMHSRINGQDNVILPKGGCTVIEITDQNGKTVRGTAECSRKDNFNRKMGNTIALGRALEKLKE